MWNKTTICSFPQNYYCISTWREMRSSGKLILHQPIPNMVTYGKRSFAYGGPRIWKNLDIKLRTIVSPETFKRELKTHLYKSVYTCYICSLSISILFLMSLVVGIMCHSIHYFTIVFNISLLQYVQLVSNVSLSCILYMLLPFDVGIIYLLDVNKYTHLVSGEIHSTFLEILLWSATEQVTGNQRYKNILLLLLLVYYYYYLCIITNSQGTYYYHDYDNSMCILLVFSLFIIKLA